MDIQQRRIARRNTEDAIGDQQYVVVRGADDQSYAVPQAVVDAAQAAIRTAHRGGSRG